MSSSNISKIDELHRKWQQSLVAFLNAELDLAFTFVSMIETDDHADSLRANVRRALETVRHFEGRIDEATAWRPIHNRADELERVLGERNEGSG